ncbi:hypothetical protein [Kitasatospora sp. NPDC056184]|uniref:hypothetical protein n=1 Tax=Kitasatospora sp. NPDC056184 TaxID=3345738 RepID=UPI0035D9BA49
MTTATALAFSHPLADELVLANRTLVASADLRTSARFTDDIWELTPALHMQHNRALKLNFPVIPVQFRLPAKEYFFALLRNDHPHGQPELAMGTVHRRFSQVKEFLVWADERGARSLSELGQDAFEAYDAHISAQHNGATALSGKRAAVRSLWHYRSKLTGDALTSDPQIAFDDSPATADPTVRRGTRENATKRIPEEVLIPLLTWALRWVEDFSDDVLRAQQGWQEARSRALPRHGLIDGTTPVQRLTAVLDTYRAARRPLPALNEQVLQMHASAPELGVNIKHIARQAQIHHSTARKEGGYFELIKAAVAELGLGDTAYVDTDIRGTLDGEPWTDGLRWDRIETYVRLLHAACYITIAYLSGMRDSEVKHMKRGCLGVWRDEQGRPVRYRVTSQAFKGEGSPDGVEATWVVSTAAAKAVRVLEALQPADQPYLFAVPPTSRHYSRGRTNSAQVGSTTLQQLALFMKWVNAFCTSSGRADGIPQVNGREWRLDTRQFRRTLAWSIARQPGGSIAGAIQYRHHSIQMFEGYAGTSASGFRHEVEAEQAIARGEKLGDIILSPAPQRLAGPAADEAEARLAAMESDVQFLGKIITDRKRLDRFMRRNDPHIYPGQFVTCVYNPDRALCRRDATDGPSLPDCQPLKCRNVALTNDNKEAFTAWLQRLEASLANATVLAPYVRDRLEQQRDDITQFLAANSIPTGQPEQTQ